LPLFVHFHSLARKFGAMFNTLIIFSLYYKLLFHSCKLIFVLHKLPVNDGFGFFEMGISFKV